MVNSFWMTGHQGQKSCIQVVAPIICPGCGRLVAASDFEARKMERQKLVKLADMENRAKKGFYCSKGWRVFSRGWAEALRTVFWIRTCYMLHVTGSFSSGSQGDSVTNCIWFLYSGQVAQSAHLHQWKPDCLVSWLPWSNKCLGDNVDTSDSMEAWSLGNRNVITHVFIVGPDDLANEWRTLNLLSSRFWDFGRRSGSPALGPTT